MRITLSCLYLLSGSMKADPRPLMKDFIGLNGHTVQFKPELYAPVCTWVRDYHPVPWDLQKDTDTLPEWPFAKNKVSWEKVYGSWHGTKLNPQVKACVQSGPIDNSKATLLYRRAKIGLNLYRTSQGWGPNAPGCSAPTLRQETADRPRKPG